MSDRNYQLIHVTIRVSRDGPVRWKYQLLDFFKYEAGRRGGFKTKSEAQEEGSKAKHAYMKGLTVAKVEIVLDASKPESDKPARGKWGRRPDPAAMNPLPKLKPPGPQ